MICMVPLVDGGIRRPAQGTSSPAGTEPRLRRLGPWRFPGRRARRRRRTGPRSPTRSSLVLARHAARARAARRSTGCRRRPVHRRRRLHGAVGGAARQGGRPGARRRAARGDAVGAGASGRNGGFVQCSLTHGIEQRLARFPDEIGSSSARPRELRRAARRHRAARDRLRVRADGEIASRSSRTSSRLEEEAELMRRFGHDAELLDGGRVRAEVNSPTYLGGAVAARRLGARRPRRSSPTGCVERRSQAGVRVCEHTPAASCATPAPASRSVSAEAGSCAPAGSLLATSAYPPLLRAIRRYIAPGLRLRAGDRAARARAARGDRLVAPPGHRRHGRTSSTTTG